MSLSGFSLRLLSRVCVLRGASFASLADPAVLELAQLDLAKFRPLPPPHGPLPTIARHSETLRRLLQLGVDLHSVSRRPEVAGYLARADFDRDIAPVVRFLHTELDLAASDVAAVLSRVPAVLLQGEMLHMTRVKSYLQDVGFQRNEVARLVAGYAPLLLTSPEDLDHLFELLQQTFVLTGDELRQLVLKDPAVIGTAPNTVRVMSATFRKSLGFALRELHSCVVGAPHLLRTDMQRCSQNFALLHSRHGLQHEVIAANPEVLAGNFRQLRERLQFLHATGRTQFDPTRPLFTAPRILAAKTDELFCAELPGVDIEQYNAFLRSM